MSVWWIIAAIWIVALVLAVYLLWLRGKNRPPRPEADNQEEMEYLREYQRKNKK